MTNWVMHHLYVNGHWQNKQTGSSPIHDSSCSRAPHLICQSPDCVGHASTAFCAILWPLSILLWPCLRDSSRNQVLVDKIHSAQSLDRWYLGPAVRNSDVGGVLPVIQNVCCWTLHIHGIYRPCIYTEPWGAVQVQGSGIINAIIKNAIIKNK